MDFGTEMNNADYHAHEAISKSKLDAARWRQALVGLAVGPPRESTAADWQRFMRFIQRTSARLLLPAGLKDKGG